MRDGWGRDITYLRISVTDRCNLRCFYCRPAGGAAEPGAEPLTVDEIQRMAAAATTIGIRRFRLTGGEPLNRGDILDVVAAVSGLPDVVDLAMSTNGVGLAPLARPLRTAGLRRVNVSLDTLRPDRFRQITRVGDWQRVWDGILAALAADLSPVKINTVVVRGSNDDEVADLAALTVDRPLHVRFIELMPLGESYPWATDRYVSAPEMQERLAAAGFRLEPLGPESAVAGAGPARYYRQPGAVGTVGFVTAVSQHFCRGCNRLRLAADGTLYPCLDDLGGTDLRTPLRRGAGIVELAAILADAVAQKPEQHHFATRSGAGSGRLMWRVGG